jgi:hypothetical protein
MPKPTTAAVALAFLALSLSASLHAQQVSPETAAEPPAEPSEGAASSHVQKATRPEEAPGTLEAQSRQSYADGDYLRFYIPNMKLHNRFPYVPQYMYNIVRACSLLEKTNTAYYYMHKMQQQGLAYDFNQTDDTLNIRNTEAYDYINNMMIEAGSPAGDGAVVTTLEGDPADYQAIAWDGSRGRLLVGTASEGKVLAVDAEGHAETLLEATADNGLWSVDGLAVDEPRKRLWISSTATPRFAGYVESDGNRSALFEFDLERLVLIARHDMPADGLYHELGGVSVTAGGMVYVVDTVMPVIYRKRPEAAGLEPFVGSEGLVAFTDVAVTPDNSRLFASDPVMGIFMVDPSAEAAAMLGGPETLNLAGIQSVDYIDGKLFVVQAGIRPERLLRLELDATGANVENVVPMAIALESFDRPGAGTIAGNDYYYFANTGAEDSTTGAIVMRTKLDAGTATNQLDINQLKEILNPDGP